MIIIIIIKSKIKRSFLVWSAVYVTKTDYYILHYTTVNSNFSKIVLYPNS